MLTVLEQLFGTFYREREFIALFGVWPVLRVSCPTHAGTVVVVMGLLVARHREQLLIRSQDSIGGQPMKAFGRLRTGLAGARVVMVSTAKFYPRHMRRAQMLADQGMSVRVYAFTREWNTKHSNSRDVEVIDLGPIVSGTHIGRVWKVFKAIRVIRNIEENELPPALCYAFGLDAAVILQNSFRQPVPLVYEVGDIRNSLPITSVTSRMIYELERYIVRRAAALVITSPAFLHSYYHEMAPNVAAKTVVVENKLPSEVLARFARPTTFNPRFPIRIGVVGLFRYPDTLLPLVDAVARRSDYELRLHGDGPLRVILQERSALARNVHYCGPFKNPDDLPRVYEDIDINYVVYDNKEFNVRLALPNKLYESIFFGRPMVVASNTELAKRVEEFGIGIAVNPMEPGFAERLLDTLTRDNLRKWSASALALPLGMVIQDEEEILTKLLMAINAWAQHRYG